MFALGIALLMIGVVVRIVFRLQKYQSTRNLNPLPVSHRSSALELIRLKSQGGLINSWILIITGTVLVLMTAVFN